jgi:hypothetical protein
MECSICLEAVTKQTGSVILSCEHSFHFRCIDNWFSKQIYDDLEQTCPCCRSKGTDLDRCEVIEEDEEEYDDETYADEESETASDLPDEDEMGDARWERLGPGRWMLINSQELALENVRGLFGPLNNLDIENDELVPAPPSEPSFRFPEGDPRREVVYHWTREEGVIVPLPPNYVEELERQEFVQQQAIRKIQAFFRGNQVRNTHEAAKTLMRLFQQAYNL